MIVDDSMMVRKQVARVLVEAGFQVVEANDGRDALEKLDATTRLVVCDINMPNMNGIEFLEALKRDGRHSPAIVMLTTEGQPETMQRAKALGAKGWLTKPFDTKLLVAAAKRLTLAA